MKTLRWLHFSGIIGKQWLRFCSKKVLDQSKLCTKLKNTNDCKKDSDSGKGDRKVAKKKATLIEGDGVSCELINAMMQVFEAAKVPIEWDVIENCVCPETNKINPQVAESLTRNKFGIKGPIERSKLNLLRKELGQYAYVTICRNMDGHKSHYNKLDCVVIRDVGEGEFSGIEHNVVPGIMQSIKVSTTAGAQRIARFVCKYAIANKRKRITVAHKANIMQLTDGNFLNSMRQEAAKHLDKIRFEERYMDTACLNLVMYPDRIDIIVSSSMYGDVLAVMASSISGGRALCPGYGVCNDCLLYDTLVGCSFNIAGKDLINPTGMLLSTSLMLNKLKLQSHGDRIRCAVEQVYRDTDIRTQDVGGKAKCSEFTAAVCEALKQQEN